MSALWWFDFDAERELELWPRPYTPARPSARTPQVLAAARQLFTSGDHLLEDALGPKGRLDPRFSEFEARAWCATPAASARFAAVGAARLPAPDPALLRHIASRRAHAEMGYALPAAFWAAGPHDLVRAGDHGVRGAMGPRAWIAKRGFTSSGRGIRRFVRGLDTDQLVRGDAEWIEASWAWGGLEFAPLLALEAEYSRHAWVSVEGAIEVGRTVLCAVDARGQWCGAHAARNVDPAIDKALGAEVERVARALAVAGYFGPVGIDAFTWKSPAGFELCARSEVHGRYSLGFAVGFGQVDEVARERAPAP